MQIEVRTQEELDREEEERRRRLMRALHAQHAEALSVLASSGSDAPEESGAGVSGAGAGILTGGARPRGTAGADAAPLPPFEPQGTFVRAERKIGRNEPCPCGSGKKYKHCHGALSSVE
jgi:preprotein translocase subunit SecA